MSCLMPTPLVVMCKLSGRDGELSVGGSQAGIIRAGLEDWTIRKIIITIALGKVNGGEKE